MKLYGLILIIFSLSSIQWSGQNYAQKSSITAFANTKKLAAFKVLEAKCNKCHLKRKKLDIFTLVNMDIFAPKIKEQVFITKRMPKGRKKLSDSELQTLKVWLASSLTMN